MLYKIFEPAFPECYANAKAMFQTRQTRIIMLAAVFYTMTFLLFQVLHAKPQRTVAMRPLNAQPQAHAPKQL